MVPGGWFWKCNREIFSQKHGEIIRGSTGCDTGSTQFEDNGGGCGPDRRKDPMEKERMISHTEEANQPTTQTHQPQRQAVSMLPRREWSQILLGPLVEQTMERVPNTLKKPTGGTRMVVDHAEC